MGLDARQGVDWDAAYAPAQGATLLTPSDSADLAIPSRGLYVGGTGNVKVTMRGGDTLLFTGLAAGVIHPISVVRVWSTTTTATSIIAVY